MFTWPALTMAAMPGPLDQPNRRWTVTPRQITCVCPNCRRTYRLLAKATGNLARCPMCGITFLVVDEIPPPPTDDDILNWLCEGEEQDEATA